MKQEASFFQIVISFLGILILPCLMIMGVVWAFNITSEIKTHEVNQVTLVNGSKVICYSVRGLASNIYTDCSDNREHFVGISDSIDVIEIKETKR